MWVASPLTGWIKTVTRLAYIYLHRQYKHLKRTNDLAGLSKQCDLCKEDLSQKPDRNRKQHIWSHLILFICECGYFHSQEHVLRLHLKKQHPGLPKYYHKVDRDNWDSIYAAIQGLPATMPPLPWMPAEELQDSDLELELEVPDIKIILKEMTGPRRKLISPIKTPTKEQLFEQRCPLSQIHMQAPPTSRRKLISIENTSQRTASIQHHKPIQYFTAKGRENQQKKQARKPLNPRVVDRYWLISKCLVGESCGGLK